MLFFIGIRRRQVSKVDLARLLRPQGHAGYERIDAGVFLKTDAPRDLVEALHADVFSTSPVSNTLKHPAVLTVELA